jgi:hypothetical protein
MTGVAVRVAVGLSDVADGATTRVVGDELASVGLLGSTRVAVADV